ncbi:substrate-binding domain-containing protein [Paraburkholderia sp. C35]|uniref:LacI family DNA-binding transcriptional regulator n=1 Tax=Paraburkholderia sp. C35 TaxID=2126993 RepID=UPI001EF70E92|nr:substrate-binding domain-containing protein [Paraburkholderia sp. C35]
MNAERHERASRDQSDASELNPIEFTPMNDLPRARLSDVASLAGVSTATVSRALSNPDVVKPDTRARIRDAIATLGYVPDGAARALALGRARMIGAIVPTLDNAIFARAVQGLQTTLSNSGYQLLISAHEYNLSAEIEVVRALLERAVDAIVLVGTDHSPQTYQLIRASQAEMLLMWSYPAQPADDSPGTLTPATIGFDNRLIGRLAATHLLELGHRRFGVISGSIRHNDRARQRIEGFRETLAQYDIRLPDACVIEQPFGFEGGRAGFKLLSQLRPAPTGIFCGNDVLALGCLLEAQAVGVAVPEALSIVGCDNLPIASQIAPGLTTVLLPTYELGERVARVLLRWLSEGVAPISESLPIELIVRGSSGPAPQ